MGTHLRAAICDHPVLPATRHRWTCPALTQARQANTRLTDPGGMEGWVGYILRPFTCPQTQTHRSSNHSIAARPGDEPATFWSNVRYATKPRDQHSLWTLRQTSLPLAGRLRCWFLQVQDESWKDNCWAAAARRVDRPKESLKSTDCWRALTGSDQEFVSTRQNSPNVAVMWRQTTLSVRSQQRQLCYTVSK